MDQIPLYEHPIGKEMGLINLVIPAPYDPDEPDTVILILTSERSADQGVVFTVEIYKEDYEGMCEDEEVETLEGCILSTFGEDLSIENVPEEPPPYRPDPPKENSTLHLLTTPNMWHHNWGRCCCVKRGDETVPVTREAINEGHVPFWRRPYTPFELDLIETAFDPEHKAMHVLLDGDLVCGHCGSPVWAVFPEEVPEELPEPPVYMEVDEPLCDDQQALEEIEWGSKRAAWEMFYEDDYNHGIIQKSKLAVARSNKRKRFSQEKLFEPFNCAHGLGRNIYTVKQAFYAALGSSRTGTWADFNLKMLRMIKGLEEVDLPVEILEMVRLEDQDEESGLKNKVQQRAVKATVDHDATILDFLLDETAANDDKEDVLSLLVDDDEDEEEFTPRVSTVREPTRQDPRPKAVPRVQRSSKEQPERPIPKKRVSSKSKKTAKNDLIAACQMLQDAIASFVEVLQEEEDEDPSSDDAATIN